MSNSVCMSCQIASGNFVPEGGVIWAGKYFNVHQDVKYQIPGFVILASNRHFKHFDEMRDDESLGLLSMIRAVRRALREKLGIEDAYYFYNEDTRHHFHLWIIPRHPWMNEFGKSIESVYPALIYAKENFNSDEDRKSVFNAVDVLRRALN